MLGKPDSGTSVDSVRLGAASNSMPPTRSCDSISGSPPSWLLGKTVTFNRPDDCAPIARAASINRSVSGWVSGVLTPSLNSNSAAALAGLLRTVVAQAAEAAPSKPLRVIFIILFSRAHYRAWEQFPSNGRRPQGARGIAREAPASQTGRQHHRMIPADETILGNPRSHPETNGG